MEPLFLLLVSALLFTQAWHLLGFFAYPRSPGIGALALSVGLLATAIVEPLSSPMLVNPDTTTMVMAVRGFILLWAVYAAIYGASALWRFEARALGVHALFLSVMSLAMVAMPYAYTETQVSYDAQIVLGTVALVLAVLTAMLFLHLAVPIRRMRAVTGWLMLTGSVVIGVLALVVFYGIFDTVPVA